ncbi:hypothetical protein [Acidovorax sp. A1169]|uniref:hypothetical protein n=1 Tax=Acidovorax sp. A1169 TaxID=3059524 RepID=UPI0027378E6E|nr:hypothetical protein [Acidovorax sp. A1169]MDP4076200.1 hypothetical protein [Acidovorax sp. A1169]
MTITAYPPQRGKVLTPEAQGERDDFDRSYDGGNCSCHLSPPCGSCTHPGNPRNQEEDPDAWMDDILDLDELEREARAAVAWTVDAAAARHKLEMGLPPF